MENSLFPGMTRASAAQVTYEQTKRASPEGRLCDAKVL
jgi:hypothetical protein